MLKARPGPLPPPSKLPSWASEFHGLSGGKALLKDSDQLATGQEVLRGGTGPSLVSLEGHPCCSGASDCVGAQGARLEFWASPTPLVSHMPGQPD